LKLSSINEWLTLAANLGVLAGILFLGLEISQNTAALRSTAYENRTNTLFDQFNMITSSEELMTGLAKMQWNTNFCDPDPSLVSALTDEENIAVSVYFRANWARYQNAHFQFQEGVLDEAYFLDLISRGLPNYMPWFDIFNVPTARNPDSGARALLSRYGINRIGCE